MKIKHTFLLLTALSLFSTVFISCKSGDKSNSIGEREEVAMDSLKPVNAVLLTDVESKMRLVKPDSMSLSEISSKKESGYSLELKEASASFNIVLFIDGKEHTLLFQRSDYIGEGSEAKTKKDLDKVLVEVTKSRNDLVKRDLEEFEVEISEKDVVKALYLKSHSTGSGGKVGEHSAKKVIWKEW